MGNAVLLAIQEDGDWLRVVPVVPIAPHVAVDDVRFQLQNMREEVASRHRIQERQDGRGATSCGVYERVFEANSVSSSEFNVLLGELQMVSREPGTISLEGETSGGAVVGKAGWALRRDGDMLYLVRCGNYVLCSTHDGHLSVFCFLCHR